MSIEYKAKIKALGNSILAFGQAAEELYPIEEEMHRSTCGWKIRKLLEKNLMKTLKVKEFSRMRMLYLLNEWGYEAVCVSKLDTVTNYLTRKVGRKRG